MIAGLVVLGAGYEEDWLIMTYCGQTACNVFEWVPDAAGVALIIWSGMSMHVDNVIVKNAEHAPKSGRMRRYRYIYFALPVTASAVFLGMITNVWSPYAPVIILFCCLLVTTCKLLIESRGEG